MSVPDAFQSVRIIRSNKRRKTVAARVEDGVLLLYLPARTSEAEAQMWVEKMSARFRGRANRDALNDDRDLQRRAARLNREHFDGKLAWASITYVTNQSSKYGSCSPGSRRIRISHKVASMPSFVLDYIVMHELSHLVEANHGARFWRLVHRYPFTERAIGYLMAHGLVPAQERVEEPSLFIPADACDRFVAAPEDGSSLDHRPPAPAPLGSAAVQGGGGDDGFEDAWTDALDDAWIDYPLTC